ncbi:hypothetical protein NW754_009120 [Fusarium falciforme]|nr:hypothetical protein NW754_009120 [Fusarium falciforme]
MPEPEVKVTFQALSDMVAHYDSEFDRILSPYEVYEDKEATIRGRIDQVQPELDSVPAPGKWQLLEEAVELGKQLKELEMNHDVNAQKDDKTYHDVLRASMDSLCLNLGERKSDLPGPSTPHKRRRIQETIPEDSVAETTVRELEQ